LYLSECFFDSDGGSFFRRGKRSAEIARNRAGAVLCLLDLQVVLI
jgi:hypothetical protein